MFKRKALILVLASVAGSSWAVVQDFFVASESTNSVKRYDIAGNFLGDFVSPGSGGLSAPQGVTFGPDGHLYVSSGGDNNVKKYHGQTGAFLGNFLSGTTVIFPADLQFYKGNLLISEFNQPGRVVMANGSSGAYIENLTGATDAELADGVVIDEARDRFFVSTATFDGSVYQGAIQQYRLSTREFLGTFANIGVGIALDLRMGADGDLYVNAFRQGKVKRYSGTTGAFVSDFVTGLSRTQGQEIGPDGSLYVGDYATSRINRYDATTGALLGTFIAPGHGGLAQPNNFVFGPRPVPEPVTMTALALGGLSLMVSRRKRPST